MSVYVAAYDIQHPGRRRRVATVLLDYGRRLRLSVFEIWLEPEDIDELCWRIGPHLGKEDRFDLYPVDLRQPSRRRSWQTPPESYEPVRVIE